MSIRKMIQRAQNLRRIRRDFVVLNPVAYVMGKEQKDAVHKPKVW